MGTAFQIGYRIRRSLLRWLRLRTRGVKVMAFNPSGELLLIRNSYGDRSLFLLPGGGIGRGESPAAAAVRELREECGIAVRDVVPLATYLSGAEGKRDTIYLFKARAEGDPRADSPEVEEAGFFPLDALPATTSPATRRRIEEHFGGRPLDGRW